VCHSRALFFARRICYLRYVLFGIGRICS
jgi:hypothetical protein